MTTSAQPAPDHVRRMYESKEVKAGEIISDGFLHYGYFDDTNRDASLAQGSERFTRILMERTPVSEGQRFCDIGCGVGVPALILAQARRCYVDGVTVSGDQQREATRRAAEQGLSKGVRFFQASALQLPFASGYYHGGWFFESIFHMGHLPALREAHRVLKPGAILLLADLTINEDATPEFEAFARGAVHSSYIRISEYPGVLADAGFELLDLTEVTKQVSAPFPEKFREAFETHRSAVLQYVDESSIRQWLAIHEELSRSLGYVIVTARKP
jgi:ubiquinone/menaquinone biosynthesis C-methylase UbiE